MVKSFVGWWVFVAVQYVVVAAGNFELVAELEHVEVQ